MNEKYSLDDFYNVLLLRNHLEFLSVKQLEDLYQDTTNFLVFLDTIAVFSEIDSAFLLFKDEYISKIERIISINRFKSNDSDIKEIINSIIIFLNQIKCYDTSYKNILKNNYLAYQEDCRKVEMDSEQILLESLGYDAVAYKAIVESNLELIKDADDYFLASINYFIEVIPELFKNNEIKQLVIDSIEKLAKKGWPFNRTNREFSNETKANLQKLK
ncbi:MAG: hypothetical protein HFJ11_04740 [Bacilli bacterium]|nr:hypothetical protein [Bacilli bacterium]